MVTISDSAITDLGHDDPEESEGSEEARVHMSHPTDTALPETQGLTNRTALATENRAGETALAELAELPNLPPDLSDDEAVEETSDDDYQPIIGEEAMPGPHAALRLAQARRQAGGDIAVLSPIDEEAREVTEDLSDDEELHQAPPRPLDDQDVSKILGQMRADTDQVQPTSSPNSDTPPQTQTESQTETELGLESRVLAAKYEMNDTRKSQAEKDQLISEFISANVMELSTDLSSDMEKLDFDDIAASKARLAAHRRNGFINARKFMFETSFDPVLIPAGAESADAGSIDVQLEGEALPPEPEPPPPPPSFSEEELTAARAVAWSEGEAAGREAARQEINQTLNHNLQNLAENITLLLAEREQQISHFGSEAGKIAAAMVGKLFPELARRGGATEIEALLHSSIELARERPRLTVSLAPHLQNLLEEKLRELAKSQGFDGQLTFIADAELGDSDARIEWSDGGIERLAARTWQNITDLLARLDQAQG